MKAAKIVSIIALVAISSISYAQLPAALAEKHPELAKDVKKITQEAKAKAKVKSTAKKEAEKTHMKRFNMRSENLHPRSHG